MAYPNLSDDRRIYTADTVYSPIIITNSNYPFSYSIACNTTLTKPTDNDFYSTDGGNGTLASDDNFYSIDLRDDISDFDAQYYTSMNDGVEVMAAGTIGITLDGVHNIPIGTIVSCDGEGRLNFERKCGEPIIGVVLEVRVQHSTEEEGSTFVQISIMPEMNNPIVIEETDRLIYGNEDKRVPGDDDADLLMHCDGTDGCITISNGDDWDFGNENITIEFGIKWFITDKMRQIFFDCDTDGDEKTVSDLMMQDFDDD